MEKGKLLSELKKRMDGALASLDHNLKGLRTGRASANLLDPIIVEAYGDRMHLNQVGTISVPEPRMIVIQVWDKGLVKAVEKAISAAEIGVTPIAEGNNIRVPIPALSEERRKELVKVAFKYGEEAKISARNVRRDGMESLKKLEKDNEITKDEHHNLSEEIQKITDDYIKKIDNAVVVKEKEITQI